MTVGPLPSTSLSLQGYRLATGTASCHRFGVGHLPARFVLSISVAVPPAEEGHPPPEESAQKGKEPINKSNADIYDSVRLTTVWPHVRTFSWAG